MDRSDSASAEERNMALYSKDYWMTPVTFGDKLEDFKRRVDNTVELALSLADGVEYKKVGGLNFLKVGALRLQWSIKAKRATKPVKFKRIKERESDISHAIPQETTIPNWQARMTIGTRMVVND
jgi:hypothetical protein